MNARLVATHSDRLLMAWRRHRRERFQCVADSMVVVPVPDRVDSLRESRCRWIFIAHLITISTGARWVLITRVVLTRSSHLLPTKCLSPRCSECFLVFRVVKFRSEVSDVPAYFGPVPLRMPRKGVLNCSVCIPLVRRLKFCSYALPRQTCGVLRPLRTDTHPRRQVWTKVKRVLISFPPGCYTCRVPLMN